MKNAYEKWWNEIKLSQIDIGLHISLQSLHSFLAMILYFTIFEKKKAGWWSFFFIYLLNILSAFLWWKEEEEEWQHWSLAQNILSHPIGMNFLWWCRGELWNKLPNSFPYSPHIGSIENGGGLKLFMEPSRPESREETIWYECDFFKVRKELKKFSVKRKSNLFWKLVVDVCSFCNVEWRKEEEE